MSPFARSMPWLIALAALAPAMADDPPLPKANPGRPTYPYARKAATTPAPKPVPADPVVRRAQAPPVPLPDLPVPPPTINAPVGGGQPLGLQVALYGAITGNPDLVALRQGAAATAEAVEVARQFPTTLNPTIFLDVRPLVYDRVPKERLGNGGIIPPKLDQKDAVFYISLRQPIELGHQTTHRHGIAKAAYDQQRWNIMQAELTALVQTYRLFQTAAYRRERLRVAEDLASFNAKLVQSLQSRLQANAVQPADVALAEVEDEATRQLAEAARQDYVVALTDLGNQLGRPEDAGTTEPLGEFTLPAYVPEIQDGAFVQLALRSRPEIFAAQAAVRGARSAVSLAKGDRIPTPVVGPQYERDETGAQFFGFVYITPLPVFNNGAPLVRQREEEARRAITALDQLQRRIVIQVKSAVSRWNGATRLVARTSGLDDKLRGRVAELERLFEANQASLANLLQARQRLIQLENARIDAVWAASQAQADLLAALGAPTLIASIQPSAAQVPAGR